ncbi:MAG: fumarate hydratase, partial [Clostridiales bacterium]|nr:fumarate hydratase [Clostridiales bacterium]
PGTQEQVEDAIVEAGSQAGSNPWPPGIGGVGLGGDFELASLLSKRALLRSLDEDNPDPYYREMEGRILEKVNRLGIGPQGLGGRTTALKVSILAHPTHIAGLPCAVNLNCHVARHASAVL